MNNNSNSSNSHSLNNTPSNYQVSTQNTLSNRDKKNMNMKNILKNYNNIHYNNKSPSNLSNISNNNELSNNKENHMEIREQILNDFNDTFDKRKFNFEVNDNDNEKYNFNDKENEDIIYQRGNKRKSISKSIDNIDENSFKKNRSNLLNYRFDREKDKNLQKKDFFLENNLTLKKKEIYEDEIENKDITNLEAKDIKEKDKGSNLKIKSKEKDNTEIDIEINGPNPKKNMIQMKLNNKHLFHKNKTTFIISTQTIESPEYNDKDKKEKDDYIQKTTRNIDSSFYLNSSGNNFNKFQDDKISLSTRKPLFRNREISASTIRSSNNINISNFNKENDIKPLKINYANYENNNILKDKSTITPKTKIPENFYYNNNNFIPLRKISGNSIHSSQEYSIRTPKSLNNQCHSINTDNPNPDNLNNISIGNNINNIFDSKKFLEVLKSPDNFKMKFLKEKFGVMKFNMLIDLFEKSKNIEEDINDDIKLKTIIGEEFRVAKNFLKNTYREVYY